MLKVRDLKVADLVMVVYDGNEKVGEVINVDHDDHKACVLTGEQEFWYDEEHLRPIPLNEAQLFKLGFTKHANEDGTIKYMKGAFRVLLHRENDFSNFEMWYREDLRQIRQPIYVHDFQNKYLEMTKVHLTKGEFIA